MRKWPFAFRHTIIKTLVVCLLLVILPTLTIGLVFQREGMEVVREELTNSYGNSLALISNQVADRLYQMTMQASAMLLDDDLVTLANRKSEKLDLFDAALFQKKMGLYSAPNFIDSNLTIFLSRYGWEISTHHGVQRMKELPQNTVDRDRNTARWAIRPSFYDESKMCLSSYCGFVYPGQSNPYALLEVDQAEMERVLGTMLENSRASCAFFVDSSGNVFTYGEELAPELRADIASGAAQALDAGRLQREVSQGGQQMRLFYNRVSVYSCQIGLVLNVSELEKPMANIRLMYVAYIVCVVLASVLSLIVSWRRIAQPTRELTNAMLSVEQGNLQVSVRESKSYEFAIIARQFNQMVSRLNTLIKESYVTQLKLKNAQLRYLRSQINPHFLYNSLFSMYNMIENGDLDSASEMALYLGKSYQRSAHLTEQNIRIMDEMENISIYVHIMSLRFPDKLRFEADLAEDTRHLLIPVLSVQTVVENAILHGMEGSSSECAVSVVTRLQEDALHICVADTGKGITEEQLADIRERLKHSVEMDDHHGLENVYMRVRLMYGEDVVMRVEHNEPVGTRVEIIIPMNRRMGSA